MTDRPMLGPTSKNRLIRLASLTLAVFATTRTDPDTEDSGVIIRAQAYEDFIRGGYWADADQEEVS